MNAEHLELGAFQNAVHSLKMVLDEVQNDPGNLFLRDAAIKRFEYCYEFAAKMITRHLLLTEDDPIAVKAMPFQDKIRRAYEIGIIAGGWNEWWHYRNDRNATAHGYSEKNAARLVAKIPAFYHEAQALLKALENIHET